MNLVIFLLVSYGITNTMVYGSSLAWWRIFWERVNPSVLGKLFTCPMCLSFWVGAFLSAVYMYYGVETPLSSQGMNNIYLVVLFDACLTTGGVWFIHTVQEWFENNQA